MSLKGVNLLHTNINDLSTDLTAKIFIFHQPDMSYDEKAFKCEVSLWKLYWKK